MAKLIATAEVEADKIETIPCKLCEKPTEMTFTRLCDGCWELDHRIRANPDIAKKILHMLQKGE